MKPIERLFDSVVFHCTVCGAKAPCGVCWEECSCGWATRRGQPCNNPATPRCSTKVKYGQKPRRGVYD